jgi:Rhodopirellula transposase DDE domain
MCSLSVHRCACAKCCAHKPHPDRTYHHQINLFLSRLNEPQRRWFAALEAMRIGHGGKQLLTQITGLSPMTIRRGCRELKSDLADCPDQGLRAPGGGRYALEVRDSTLEAALETILATETAGDPMGRRPKAKRSSLRSLAARLTMAGHPASRTTVARLLRKTGYSPKANARRAEARGTSPEQRNAQFEHIAEQRSQFTMAGDPVISVDTKKRN